MSSHLLLQSACTCCDAFYCSITRRPPSATLFPYTTLFRSRSQGRARLTARRRVPRHRVDQGEDLRLGRAYQAQVAEHVPPRSEEHTSELQSRLHLVCRLLLEKKKIENICRPFSMTATPAIR